MLKVIDTTGYADGVAHYSIVSGHEILIRITNKVSVLPFKFPKLVVDGYSFVFFNDSRLIKSIDNNEIKYDRPMGNVISIMGVELGYDPHYGKNFPPSRIGDLYITYQKTASFYEVKEYSRGPERWEVLPTVKYDDYFTKGIRYYRDNQFINEIKIKITEKHINGLLTSLVEKC